MHNLYPCPQITHFATKQILPNIIVPCSHPACMKLLCIVPNIKATINSSMTYQLRFTPRCLHFGGSSHPAISWQLPGTSHSQSVQHAFPSTWNISILLIQVHVHHLSHLSSTTGQSYSLIRSPL